MENAKRLTGKMNSHPHPPEIKASEKPGDEKNTDIMSRNNTDAEISEDLEGAEGSEYFYESANSEKDSEPIKTSQQRRSAKKIKSKTRTRRNYRLMGDDEYQPPKARGKTPRNQHAPVSESRNGEKDADADANDVDYSSQNPRRRLSRPIPRKTYEEFQSSGGEDDDLEGNDNEKEVELNAKSRRRAAAKSTKQILSQVVGVPSYAPFESETDSNYDSDTESIRQAQAQFEDIKALEKARFNSKQSQEVAERDVETTLNDPRKHSRAEDSTVAELSDSLPAEDESPPSKVRKLTNEPSAVHSNRRIFNIIMPCPEVAFDDFSNALKDYEGVADSLVEVRADPKSGVIQFLNKKFKFGTAPIDGVRQPYTDSNVDSDHNLIRSLNSREAFVVDFMRNSNLSHDALWKNLHGFADRFHSQTQVGSLQKNEPSNSPNSSYGMRGPTARSSGMAYTSRIDGQEVGVGMVDDANGKGPIS